MAGKKICEVIVITSEAFPYGMAGTNRIISLCKGFKANGLKVRVLTFYKYDEFNHLAVSPPNGIYEGIEYKNVFKSTIKNRHKVLRAFHEYLKTVLVFLFCLKFLKKNRLVLYYSPKTWPAIFIKFVSTLRGSLVIKEETEHPFLRTNRGKKFYKSFYLKYHYNIFDGLFVITQSLSDFFRNEVNYKKPIFLVPMIVDIDRFANESIRANKSVVFSGVLDDKKEGLSMLIKGFAEVLKKHSEFTLNIYGRASDDSKENLYKELISNLKMENSVILHGYKNRDEMTKVFLSAGLFVLSRPPSLQATYGFSTKLGEYLATGKPVIATRMGEIEKYLKDRNNAFLCEPDIASITETICEVLDDYDFALKIGKEGRNCAFEYFNNKTEIGKVMDKAQTIYNLQYIKSAEN